MKIDIPFEIGDPVLVIDYNQYYGYYIGCRPFSWEDIPNIGKSVFKNLEAATERLKELEKTRK